MKAITAANETDQVALLYRDVDILLKERNELIKENYELKIKIKQLEKDAQPRELD